jgi:PAS domain S-box-containing protein
MKLDPALHGAGAAPNESATGLGEGLVRDALLGAGTSVWEWHVQSDRLSNVDTSAALLGYGPGEMGSTQAMWNLVIHPDERAANHAAYLRHASGRTPIYEHEYRARCKDGSWRWVAERGRIVERDGRGQPLRMVGTLSDITERRRAEAEALSAAQRLREITRQVPGVVYQYRMHANGSGSFSYVSDSCIELLGLMPEELMADASRGLRIIDREDRARAFASVEAARRAMRHWRCEFRLYLRGGVRRWVSVSATPRLEEDGSLLWHGYLEDVHDLRELARVREQAAAAQASNRAKTEFLSRMSHELRTPLNAVLGFAQLLEIDTREPLGELQRKRVALIREAGDHLLRMIGELLDLTRIESGRLTVDLVAVPLHALMRDCAEMVRPQADAAGVTLLAEPCDPALQVCADPTRLRQVLLNLLTNATKYNRRHGGVTLRATAGSTEVALQVVDTGVGIGREELPHIFEPFHRGAHRHSAIEGTGIGLAVTQALVDLMHGRLEVQSTPDVGSTFTVTLPRARG